jgi:nucleoside-diphosphate-sugar epimerase
LAARGERVFAVSRAPPVDADRQATWLRGDLCGEMSLLPPLDAIVSLGPLDAFAAWFAQVPPAGVRRVLALGSMSAESKRASIDPAERELSARLRAAEERLLRAATEHRADCTIFRPTLIYGTGHDRSLAPIAHFARRWRILPIPRGANGVRQPVHAADLAAACLAAYANAATFGKIYPLGGGERLRFDAMLARIAAGPPRLALALPVPFALARAGAAFLRIGAGALARLTEPLIADNTAAARDFGYAPRGFCAREVG